jgi:hypothetical protein
MGAGLALRQQTLCKEPLQQGREAEVSLHA